MKFNFRLEKVLNFIRIRETLKKMEVATETQKLRFIQGQHDSLIQSMRNTLSMQTEKLSVGTEWLSYQTQKIAWDSKESVRLEKLMREQEELLENKKYELNRIILRRKGIESVKEKRYAEYKFEQNRKAQKTLDENFQLLKGRKN